MLKSDLCDYNDAYIVVKGVITVSAEEAEMKIIDKLF